MDKEVLQTEKKSDSGYALIKFEKDADAVSAFEHLHKHENVQSCKAVKGDFDLVILMHADDLFKLSRAAYHSIFQRREKFGIENFVFLPVEKSILMKKSKPGVASSYVMVELEKGQEENIIRAVNLNDLVVSSDLFIDVEGNPGLMVCMQGSSFKDINRSIRGWIAPLHGVLRTKELPISS